MGKVFWKEVLDGPSASCPPPSQSPLFYSSRLLVERKPDVSEVALERDVWDDGPLELQSREELLAPAVPPTGVLTLGCSILDTVDMVVSIRLALKTLVWAWR